MDIQVITAALSLSIRFTSDLQIPQIYKTTPIGKLLPIALKGKSKREDAFIEKILSWENTINVLLDKHDNKQAWQFINLLPIMDKPIKSAAYHQDFLDFTDYFILRRDIENCPDDELCDLSLLHTEFHKQIANNLTKINL